MQPNGIIGKLVSAKMKSENDILYDIMLEKLDIKDKECIFEIGYGHGLGINKILTKHDCFVTGIDFSELMYNEATKRNKEYIDSSKALLNYGDFLNYKIDKQNYDKIFCLNVTYFWDNLKVPFSKIASGLKHNGVFCIYMIHPSRLKKLKFAKNGIFNKYSIEKVVAELKDSGFKSVDYQYNKGYFIVCKK